MRHWIPVMIAVLFALPCFAQSPGKQRTSLDIGGVTVWLGMPRQEVVEKCASAGYKQLVSEKDHIWFALRLQPTKYQPATPSTASAARTTRVMRMYFII
jgi:hypothetical protein